MLAINSASRPVDRLCEWRSWQHRGGPPRRRVRKVLDRITIVDYLELNWSMCFLVPCALRLRASKSSLRRVVHAKIISRRTSCAPSA
eukprot:8637888-Pyramimonas_sp.AAC.1